MHRVLFLSLALLLLTTACGAPLGPGGGNRVPVAAITATPASGTAPLTVSFDGSASSDPDGTIASFTWAFGDGGLGSGATTSHTYTNPGTYTASLLVRDQLGASGSASVTIQVTAPGSPEPGDPGPGDPTDPTNPGAAAQVAAALAVIGIAGDKEALEQEFIEAAIETVIAASQAAGVSSPVFNGTLTVQSSGATSYSPVPTDRLVALLPSGVRLEFAFSAFDGNLSASTIAQFLREPHALAFSMTFDPGAGQPVTAVTLASERNPSEFSVQLQGQLARDGQVHGVDLLTTGTYRLEVDGALDYEFESRTQGTITGEGFTAQVDEGFRFRFFQLDNAIEINERAIATTWQVGSASFALEGFIRRDFFNGSPAEFDAWRAEGVLMRNGTQVGGLGLATTGGISLDVFLELDGQRHVLTSDLLN